MILVCNVEQLSLIPPVISSLLKQIYVIDEVLDSASKTKIFNFEFLFQAIGRYSYPNADFQEGKNLGSILCQEQDALTLSLQKFAREAIAALGQVDGVYHMEIFKNDAQELIFLETAIRPIGLYGVQNYEDTYGINLYELDFKIQVQADQFPLIKDPSGKEKGSFFILPLANKTIETLQEPQLQSPYTLTWEVKVGDRPKASGSNLDFAGVVCFKNTNYAQLEADFEYLKNQYIPLIYAQ